SVHPYSGTTFRACQMLFQHHLTFLHDKTNGNSHDYSTGREPQFWSKTIFHLNLKAKSRGLRL
ncbi:MAG: hypothetical protein WAN82_05695, partial [Candidatus Bathyarchaeia archaeon]